jgi:hypothetical protein
MTKAWPTTQPLAIFVVSVKLCTMRRRFAELPTRTCEVSTSSDSGSRRPAASATTASKASNAALSSASL